MSKTKRKSELDLAVGQALKQYRKSVGLTQSEAAEALSTTQVTLSNYENGITTVSPTTLHAAFATYKATPNEFFETAEKIAAEQVTQAIEQARRFIGGGK